MSEAVTGAVLIALPILFNLGFALLSTQPNGIELHPVLRLSNPICQGAGRVRSVQ
jgi:hypothetical protein